MRILLVLALLPFVGLAGPEGRRYAVNVHLAGRDQARPAVEVVHEMRGPAKEIILHFLWERGFYRKSKHDNTRGTTGGVYIEVNDADEPTHPVRNPFSPLPVQAGANPDWKEYVGRDFPYPNPEAGYWYTWAKERKPFERVIRLKFVGAGRYRIRVRGVLVDEKKDKRVPTLTAITEIGRALDRDAPDYRKKTLTEEQGLVVPKGVLQVQRDAPAEVKVGAPFNSVITVKNLTDEPVLGVVVIETGQGKLKYAEGPTDADLRTASWDIGTLKPNETRRILVQATPLEAGALTRAVIVRYDSKPLLQTTTVVK